MPNDLGYSHWSHPITPPPPVNIVFKNNFCHNWKSQTRKIFTAEIGINELFWQLSFIDERVFIFGVFNLVFCSFANPSFGHEMKTNKMVGLSWVMSLMV